MYTLNRWSAASRWRVAWLGGAALLLLVLILGGPSPAAATAPALKSEVERIPAGTGKVALTFDAGEWPGRVQTILDTLARHHVKATFFLCGIYIDSFPSRAKAIAAAGHELASHSYHNVDHRRLSNQQILNEVRLQEAALLRVTGRHNVPYWRAPYGYRDSRVLSVVNRLGYRSIQWSLDSLDTVGQPKSANFIFNRLTVRPRSQLDGAILLLHVNPDGTVDALDRVLTYFERVGLHQVTVGDLLGD